MGLFHACTVFDYRPPATEYDCGVEVVVCAESRMDATAALRKRGFIGVHARELRAVEPGEPDLDGNPLPPVGPGEIWARAKRVPGDWEKR